jgi:hypothetical protein
LFLQDKHWFWADPEQVRQVEWQLMLTQFPRLLKENPELQAQVLSKRRVAFVLQLVHWFGDWLLQFSQVLLQLRQNPVLVFM